MRSCREERDGRKNGVWRSLVARLTGGQEAAGSNPVTPSQREIVVYSDLIAFTLMIATIVKIEFDITNKH